MPILHIRASEWNEHNGFADEGIEYALRAEDFEKAEGNTDQAIATLKNALTLAEPEGFIRIFVDEGPQMSRLLYEAIKRDVSPDYTNQLLAAFPVVESEQTDPSKAQALKSALVEPLSEREIEVIQLIAEGLSNQEIGSRLFFSLNTVKAHTRNIYAKLSVHNRTQAAARAKDLGIFPPHLIP